jgi:hypothetical protein
MNRVAKGTQLKNELMNLRSRDKKDVKSKKQECLLVSSSKCSNFGLVGILEQKKVKIGEEKIGFWG